MIHDQEIAPPPPLEARVRSRSPSPRSRFRNWLTRHKSRRIHRSLGALTLTTISTCIAGTAQFSQFRCPRAPSFLRTRRSKRRVSTRPGAAPPTTPFTSRMTKSGSARKLRTGRSAPGISTRSGGRVTCSGLQSSQRGHDSLCQKSDCTPQPASLRLGSWAHELPREVEDARLRDLTWRRIRCRRTTEPE